MHLLSMYCFVYCCLSVAAKLIAGPAATASTYWQWLLCFYHIFHDWNVGLARSLSDVDHFGLIAVVIMSHLFDFQLSYSPQCRKWCNHINAELSIWLMLHHPYLWLQLLGLFSREKISFFFKISISHCTVFTISFSNFWLLLWINCFEWKWLVGGWSDVEAMGWHGLHTGSWLDEGNVIDQREESENFTRKPKKYSVDGQAL